MFYHCHFRLLESVEILVENLPVPEVDISVEISKRTFSITLLVINTSDITDGKMYESPQNPDGQSPGSVFLPQELIKLTRENIIDENNHSSLPLIALTTYRSEGLFIRREKSLLNVNSNIVSVSIARMNVEGLNEPVVITIDSKVSMYYVFQQYIC